MLIPKRDINYYQCMDENGKEILVKDMDIDQLRQEICLLIEYIEEFDDVVCNLNNVIKRWRKGE